MSIEFRHPTVVAVTMRWNVKTREALAARVDALVEGGRERESAELMALGEFEGLGEVDAMIHGGAPPLDGE